MFECFCSASILVFFVFYDFVSNVGELGVNLCAMVKKQDFEGRTMVTIYTGISSLCSVSKM